MYLLPKNWVVGMNVTDCLPLQIIAVAKREKFKVAINVKVQSTTLIFLA